MPSTNLKAALVNVAAYLKPLGSSLLGAARSAATGILQFFASVIIAGFLLRPVDRWLRPGRCNNTKRVARRHRRFTLVGNYSNRSVGDFDPGHYLELDNDGDNSGPDLYSLHGAGEVGG